MIFFMRMLYMIYDWIVMIKKPLLVNNLFNFFFCKMSIEIIIIVIIILLIKIGIYWYCKNKGYIKGGEGQLQFFNNGNDLNIDFENHSLINNANIPFCDIYIIVTYYNNQTNQSVIRATNTRFNLGALANNEMCIISFSLRYINIGHYRHVYRIITIPIDDINFDGGRVSYKEINEHSSGIQEEEIIVDGCLPVLPILALFAGNKQGNRIVHPMYDLVKNDELRDLRRYCALPTINTNHYCIIFVKIDNLYYTFDGSYIGTNNDVQTTNMYGV